MSKICVFCGKPIRDKSLEHVLPQWLLELTGDPRRVVNLGLYEGARKYSFSSFKFPACARCNEDYSDLEGNTKTIILKILKGDAISASSFTILLDWFDKVRTGLWLGYLMLDKNPMNIRPHFYISNRIASKDRLLYIYKAIEQQDGLNFAGVTPTSFATCPACIGLRINNSYFINMSYDFLFSRRFGLPFATDMKIIEIKGKQLLQVNIKPGFNRATKPVINAYYDHKCTEIYQNIYSESLSAQVNARANDYSRKYYYEGSNKGRIIIKKNGEYIFYSENESIEWRPSQLFEHVAGMSINCTLSVHKLQMHILKNAPSGDSLPRERRKIYETIIKQAIKTQETLISNIQKNYRLAL